VLGTLRRAAETCSISPDDGTARFVGQLRSVAEHEVAQAEAMRAARQCLTQSATLDVLHRCLADNSGTSPSAAQWQNWVALFNARHPS
jgi:hypothetical protein